MFTTLLGFESGSRELTNSTEFVTSTRVSLRPPRIAPTKSALQNSNLTIGWPKNIYLVHSAFRYSVLTPSRGSVTGSVIGSVCWEATEGKFDAHSWESIAGPAFAVPFSGAFQHVFRQARIHKLQSHASGFNTAGSPSLCFQRKLSGSVSCVQRRHRHALICGLLHHRRIGVSGFFFVAMDFAIIFGIEGAMLRVEVLGGHDENEAVFLAFESGGVVSALRVDHAFRE